MDQPYVSQENQAILKAWLFQEAIDLQKDRKDLEREKEEFLQAKDELESLKIELERLKTEIKNDKEELNKEKQAIEQLREKMQQEQLQLKSIEKGASMREDFERQRLERNEHLFQMKWKMMEEELIRLAEEKKEFERMKNSVAYTTVQNTNCSILFSGVRNELALKKRYRDLMKIFHPDNIAGDHDVVVEISKEFEVMKEQLCVVE